MNDKEMQEAANYWIRGQQNLLNFEPATLVHEVWQAACAWMMGKAEPVYQLDYGYEGWADVSKEQYESLKDFHTSRILYTASPSNSIGKTDHD